MWTPALLFLLHSRGSAVPLLATRSKHGTHHVYIKILSYIHNCEPALESSIFWISLIINCSLVLALLLHFLSSFPVLLHHEILRFIFLSSAHSNYGSFIPTMPLHRYHVRLSLKSLFFKQQGTKQSPKGSWKEPYYSQSWNILLPGGGGRKWEDMGGGSGSKGQPFWLRVVVQNEHVTWSSCSSVSFMGLFFFPGSLFLPLPNSK